VRSGYQEARWSVLIVNELGYEMALKTIQGEAIFDGGKNRIPCCRRVVAEGAPTKMYENNNILYY